MNEALFHGSTEPGIYTNRFVAQAFVQAESGAFVFGIYA